MTKIYTTISGDEWDGICYKVYGTELVMDKVMHANLPFIHYAVFPAGVVLTMPDLDTVEVSSDLPPWMR